MSGPALPSRAISPSAPAVPDQRPKVVRTRDAAAHKEAQKAISSALLSRRSFRSDSVAGAAPGAAPGMTAGAKLLGWPSQIPCPPVEIPPGTRVPPSFRAALLKSPNRLPAVRPRPDALPGERSGPGWSIQRPASFAVVTPVPVRLALRTTSPSLLMLAGLT